MARSKAGNPVRVGCAGWSIPRLEARRFSGTGTHLQRYAASFDAVEINSSFYVPHRRSTYERWASSVPQRFSFSVKLPRDITHDARLEDVGPLVAFFGQVDGLGNKLGVVLVQLPPSLAFDVRTARRFFAAVRKHYGGALVCEPRHPSWFARAADRLLRDVEIARVAADPACVPAAAEPGCWTGVVYYRLHGSPRTYWSSYDSATIDSLAARLRACSADAPTWCIFDNTAAGAATMNALALRRRLRSAT